MSLILLNGANSEFCEWVSVVFFLYKRVMIATAFCKRNSLLSNILPNCISFIIFYCFIYCLMIEDETNKFNHLFRLL